MCRNIRPLFHFDPPVTEEEIRAASLQFVRKISGFHKPSKANQTHFDAAVEEVARASARLLGLLETNGPAKNREEKIDKQMQDSFPASDPPSFSGGNHIIGAPKERESDAPTADSHAVKEAEKKVKDGTAKEAHKY